MSAFGLLGPVRDQSGSHGENNYERLSRERRFAHVRARKLGAAPEIRGGSVVGGRKARGIEDT